MKHRDGMIESMCAGVQIESAVVVLLAAPGSRRV